MAGMNEPLILSRNCANCEWFDADCHCGLPWREALIRGGILEPEQVVCAKHQPIEDDIEGAAV